MAIYPLGRNNLKGEEILLNVKIITDYLLNL